MIPPDIRFRKHVNCICWIPIFCLFFHWLWLEYSLQSLEVPFILSCDRRTLLNPVKPARPWGRSHFKGNPWCNPPIICSFIPSSHSSNKQFYNSAVGNFTPCAPANYLELVKDLLFECSILQVHPPSLFKLEVTSLKSQILVYHCVFDKKALNQMIT